MFRSKSTLGTHWRELGTGGPFSLSPFASPNLVLCQSAQTIDHSSCATPISSSAYVKRPILMLNYLHTDVANRSPIDVTLQQPASLCLCRWLNLQHCMQMSLTQYYPALFQKFHISHAFHVSIANRFHETSYSTSFSSCYNILLCILPYFVS